MWLTGGVPIFILFWTPIYALKNEPSVLLTRLLTPNSLPYATPVIIIVVPENQLRLLRDDRTPDSSSSDTGDIRDDETPNDEDAYLLYNALRTQPQDNLSPSEIKQLEETKQVLRGALRARCVKLDKCVKKCPKNKKKCRSKCQERIDKENACGDTDDDNTTNKMEPECEEEEKCETKEQKWGKTMPPDWLLRLRLD